MTAKVAPVTEPVVLEARPRENGVEIDLLVPSDLLYFKGHFREFPVLPGVVQLHWAIAFGGRHFDLGAALPDSIQVKFKGVIVPTHRICLLLGYDASRRKLSFEYRDTTGMRSSGLVSFLP